MPEVSNMPLPAKLLAKGITDMVRICDGRMSGTAYGTVVLHVSPEAAAGGPLGLVQDGDIITLDVAARKITLEVSDAELAARKLPAETRDGFANPDRGWARLYIDHVQQAELGVDMDFLQGSSGSYIPRESH
jgi:dihydroxyacid dehydratase/phosphogluconate dehydratase